MTRPGKDPNQPLSLKYAVFCVVDMVGLFPVIALPRAIINCGWLGIPLAFFMFLIEIYTAVLLGRCWIIGEKIDERISHKTRCPYGALVELAFGNKMSTYVKILLDLSIFGACVPDLLIASQNMQVIGMKISHFQMDLSHCYWLLIIGALTAPLMWLGSPKDMKFIGVTSVFIVLITSLLTWSSILSVDSGGGGIPQPSWESVGIAYGTLAFQFDVHPMILSVQMDMENKKDVGKAIIIAFMVSGGLFVITLALCYIVLGDKTHYNTLESLPGSTVQDLALSLATLQVCLSMAVGSTTFFQDIEHSLNISPEFGWRRVVFRSSLVLLAVAIGEVVPRFDLLMGLVGGALTGQLIFLFPPLLFRKLRKMMPPASAARTSPKDTGLLPSPFWVPPEVDGNAFGAVFRKSADDDCVTLLRAPSSGVRSPSLYPDLSHFLMPEESFTSHRAKTPLRTVESYQRNSDTSLGLVNLTPPELQVGLKKYGTFSELFQQSRGKLFSSSMHDDVFLPSWFRWMIGGRLEEFLLLAVPLAGVAATLISTFFSFRETLVYAEFAPSCLFNHTSQYASW